MLPKFSDPVTLLARSLAAVSEAESPLPFTHKFISAPLTPQQRDWTWRGNLAVPHAQSWGEQEFKSPPAPLLTRVGFLHFSLKSRQGRQGRQGGQGRKAYSFVQMIVGTHPFVKTYPCELPPLPPNSGGN